MIAALAMLAAQAPALQDLNLEPVPHHLGVAALGPGGEPRLVSLTGRLLRLVEEPELKIQLNGESVLWTIADVDADGADEVVVLLEGRELRRVTRAGDQLLGPVRDAALRQAMAPARNAANVVLAGLGEELGVVSAATVAFERLPLATRQAAPTQPHA